MMRTKTWFEVVKELPVKGVHPPSSLVIPPTKYLSIDYRSSYSGEEVLTLLVAGRGEISHTVGKEKEQQGGWQTVKSRNTIKKERVTASV